eukprot:11108498-Alexandrium_andersonii.AAC.1
MLRTINIWHGSELASKSHLHTELSGMLLSTRADLFQGGRTTERMLERSVLNSTLSSGLPDLDLWLCSQGKTTQHPSLEVVAMTAGRALAYSMIDAFVHPSR